MKVLVYGPGEAPECIRRVQSYQAESAAELREAVLEFSGGEFIIVVLDRDLEVTACKMSHLVAPRPKVISARPGREWLVELTSPTRHRPYHLPC